MALIPKRVMDLMFMTARFIGIMEHWVLLANQHSLMTQRQLLEDSALVCSLTA
jgi:hypothetical protein